MERCDSGVSVVSNGINSVVSLCYKMYGMQSHTISDTRTVVPTKSDSDVILCLQLLN